MKIELETADIDRLSTQIMLRLTESLKSGIKPVALEEDTVYTVETLAEYLCTTSKWVYNHISDLPHFRIDGLLRFRKRAVDRLFEQHPSKLPKR